MSHSDGSSRPCAYASLRSTMTKEERGGGQNARSRPPPAFPQRGAGARRGPGRPEGRSGAWRPLPVPSQAGAAYVVPRGCGGECGAAGLRSFGAGGAVTAPCCWIAGPRFPVAEQRESRAAARSRADGCAAGPYRACFLRQRRRGERVGKRCLGCVLSSSRRGSAVFACPQTAKRGR